MFRRSLLRDLLIAAVAFAVLAMLPQLTSSTALLDFVIRCAALALFATSLNLLVGYGGMVSFGHGLFFGLGAYSFGLIMQQLGRSEEHTSELQSRQYLVCRLLLEKKKT